MNQELFPDFCDELLRISAKDQTGIEAVKTVLIDYVLYRAYAKDSKHTANMQRSTNHYQAFQNALGLKSRGEMMLAPAQQFGAGAPAQPSDGGGQ